MIGIEVGDFHYNFAEARGEEMKEAAASSSERGRIITETVADIEPTSAKGHSYWNIKETAAPSSDNILYSKLITETAALSPGNLLYCKLITESAAPASDNLFYSKITETAAPSSNNLSHTEAAAPTLETGFSYRGRIKEAEASTSERAFFLSTITEAAPSSEKGVFVNPVTETTAPSAGNGFSHYKIEEAAAPTSEISGVCYCKFTEAGVPTSEKGVILSSICTEIAALTLENRVSNHQNKDQAARSAERGVSHCKIKGTGMHTAEEGVIFNSITEIPAPALQNGGLYYQNKDVPAPISERGVSHSKIKEVFGHPITETAASSALENRVLCYEDSTAESTSEKGAFLNPVTETAAPAPENGVSYYKPGFPDVLRPPSPSKQITDDSKVSLYTYIIHYSVLQEGQDPINIAPPTQFVLLNHLLLDEEIAHHFSVRLNLPHQECVTAHLTPCDMISFTLDQVNTIEVFNGVLFSIVHLRSKLDFENFYTVENKTKGYYVMPLRDGVDLRTEAERTEELIDWTMAFDLVHCKLNMKKWMHYHATLGPDTNSCFLNDTGAFVKGWLRLKSGVYTEEDLIDAFVTYGPFNTSCFIVGISDELCGSSIMQGSDCCPSYKDYWLKRFEVELKYASQPLLVGYCLSHAGNFLQRPSEEALWCKAKAKRVMIPPEVCVLQTGLKGSLWRGAFRLPSILCGLENALLAAQLRDQIGPQISVFKMQEALTSGAYNVYQSYERLELVGDSFLTLVAATALYMKDLSMNKIDLASALHSLVENKHLFRCAEACGLASYVFNEPFQVKGWIPPGRTPECLQSSGKKAQARLLRGQRISWRTLADVVEAIVGAYAMYGSMTDALKAMSWLRVTIEYPQTAAGMLFSGNAVAEVSSMPGCQIADLERRLKYSFKNHDLVSMALCYHSGEWDGGLHFSRLAYLGDCILSHYVARHLITVHQSLDVGKINEMKQSVVNKENLACAAARNKLHTFITGLTLSHKESILMYASTLEKEIATDKMLPAYGFIGLCAPKGLGDLISSIGAAIFLDCELDSELVWKILQPFLEPLPEPGSFSLHPINELTQFCKARLLLLDVQSSFQSGVYKTHVIVNQESITNFEHEEKRYARKYAAVQALHELKLREVKSEC